MHYNQLYDDTEREWICKDDNKHKKQIYTLKQRGLNDKIFVAKKYIYKKDKYIDKIWDEVNSIIKMRNHQHPNVIKYHDIFMFDLYQNDIDYQVCIMVMEKGDYTLEQFVNTAIRLEKERQQLKIEELTIKKNKKPNQQQLQQHYENLIYQYLKQTLSGCQFLKSKNIYHRDYKPKNLVLLNNEVKIIDFDIVKITQLDITQDMSGIKGTKLYMDPSLIKIMNYINQNQQEDPQIRYNLEMMDIYSIGCTFLKLAMKWNDFSCNQYVLYTKNFYDNQQYKEQQTYLQQVTSQLQHQKLKQILCNMLVLDQKIRWNLEECIQEQLIHQIKPVQIKQERNKQLIPWLTNDQIEILENDKFIIDIFDYCVYPQQYPQSRYLVIKTIKKQQIGSKTDEFIKIINNQFQLTKLELEFTQISTQMMRYFFQKITNFKNIKILYFYLGVEIEQDVMINWIEYLFFRCPNLQILNLRIDARNEISKAGVKKLGSAIEKFNKLQKLHLEFGEYVLGKVGIQGIAQGIGKQLDLEILHLRFGHSYLKDESFKSIGQAIGNLLALKTLHLKIEPNDITAVEAKHIGQGIQKLSNLEIFYLEIRDYNQIGDQGAIEIGHALEKLSKLKTLYLQFEYNGIKQDGMKGIGYGIGKLSNLQILFLKIQDGIYGDGAQSIGSAIGKLTTLDTLFIESMICEKGIMSIGSAIGKLSTLKQIHLDFYYEYYRKEVVKQLVFSMLNLKDLSNIKLYMGRQEYNSKEELQQLLLL